MSGGSRRVYGNDVRATSSACFLKEPTRVRRQWFPFWDSVPSCAKELHCCCVSTRKELSNRSSCAIICFTLPVASTSRLRYPASYQGVMLIVTAVTCDGKAVVIQPQIPAINREYLHVCRSRSHFIRSLRFQINQHLWMADL